MNDKLTKTVAFCALIAMSSWAPAEDIVIDRVFVTLIQEVEIPARKSGVLESLLVQEGSVVTRNQELARIDDRQAAIDLQHAKTELEVAVHKANDLLSLELASKTHEKETQALRQRTLESQAARRAADNLLKIQAAEKARDVAKNELDRALQARAEFVDAVSQSEVDGIRLAHQRAELEAKQAKFEQQQESISADASDESVKLQELSIEQSRIAVEQAKSEKFIAELDARLHENAVESAALSLEQHRIRSSIDGVVVELMRHEGEWLKPGDPVMRVLRLNRLRVEGFLPLSQADDELVGREVNIMINGSKPIELKGKVSLVSKQVDAVNQEIAVWAEFDNPGLRVRPGMQGTMTIVGIELATKR